MVKTMENDNQAKGAKPRCYTSLAQMRQGELALHERLVEDVRDIMQAYFAVHAPLRLVTVEFREIRGIGGGRRGINGINRDSFVGDGQSGPSFNLGYKD
jgi:hypothetical protein